VHARHRAGHARRDDRAGGQLVPAKGAAEVPGTWRIIWTAFAVNVLNPKLTLFFFAFLPQGRGW
jgi:threonine/homoserine/homoserine lactone efflux protein